MGTRGRLLKDPGDSCIGSSTQPHKWYDKATWRYYAYDFGGGSGGSGPVEHKVYQLTAVSGGTAKRVNDSR